MAGTVPTWLWQRRAIERAIGKQIQRWNSRCSMHGEKQTCHKLICETIPRRGCRRFKTWHQCPMRVSSRDAEIGSEAACPLVARQKIKHGYMTRNLKLRWLPPSSGSAVHGAATRSMPCSPCVAGRPVDLVLMPWGGPPSPPSPPSLTSWGRVAALVLFPALTPWLASGPVENERTTSARPVASHASLFAMAAVSLRAPPVRRRFL